MVRINYKKHRKAVERFYTDRCTVYRYKKRKKPGSGKTIQELVTFIENQPCRISQKALGTNGQTDAQNNIAYETKLFIAPEVEIKQGDMLEVTRGRITKNGWDPVEETRKYHSGEPFPYPTHQEISIQRKEWA
nr:ABC transporter ATP-binding protein [Aneurinibacillus sp. XH2]